MQQPWVSQLSTRECKGALLSQHVYGTTITPTFFSTATCLDQSVDVYWLA